MKPIFEIHPIQTKILHTLQFHPEARFSQLNIDKVPTDQFNFHLKALLESDLVSKDNNGKYHLTISGKEFANRFDTQNFQFEKQAKVSVVVYCSRIIAGQKKYLLQKRLKQPYFGYVGPIGGKIRWGESIFETARRELKEEANLEATKITLMRVKHKMDFTPDQKLAEDKYFFVLRATGIKGKLKTDFTEGQNLWLSKREILKLPLVFDDFDKTMKAAEQKKLVFQEAKYTVSGF